MIIYLASYPRSGNTFTRQLISHYFRRYTNSVYEEDGKHTHINRGFLSTTDSDPRYRTVKTDGGSHYRALNNAPPHPMTLDFRQELAEQSEVFFIKTHELPFDEYLPGEYVLRLTRHPGAALWSYFNYTRDVNQEQNTIEAIINGRSVGAQNWSTYTAAWLATEQAYPQLTAKFRYEDLVRDEKPLLDLLQSWTSLPLREAPGTFPNFQYWNKQSASFYRSGSTDEWTNKLTDAQLILLYQKHGDAAAREGYRFDFPPPVMPVDYDVRIFLAQKALVDTAEIPKVADAGQVQEQEGLRLQTMFNGIKVLADSYYGPWYTELIQKCEGHHEPQEEYIFHHLVQRAPEGAVMFELGSYWAFYSTWFLKFVPRSRAVLVEPQPENLAVSHATLALNGCSAVVELAALGQYLPDFEKLCIGGAQTPNYIPPLVTVDELMQRHMVEHLYILHSDIQGAEGKMLEGAERALARQCIDYVVISTHDYSVHTGCREYLAGHGYRILAEHTPNESYTYDGLLVACSPAVVNPPVFQIHKRTAQDWTWDQAVASWDQTDEHMKKHNQIILPQNLRGLYTTADEERNHLRQAIITFQEQNAALLSAQEGLNRQINDLASEKSQLEAQIALFMREREAIAAQARQLGVENTSPEPEPQPPLETIQVLMKVQQDQLRLNEEVHYLHTENERLHRVIDSVRKRKINRILKRLGRPLV